MSCRSECSYMTNFWVKFVYPENEEPEHSHSLRMFQHPIKGDIVHKNGCYYEVKRVIYDLDRERILLECELYNNTRL